MPLSDPTSRAIPDGRPAGRGAIGVLGGLGPYAGLDLVRALFDETTARADQDHLPVTLISYPDRIPDRSPWILDPENQPSPVPAMVEVLRRLHDAGCSIVGIPCNTAHAPVLFDRLLEAMEIEGRRIRILHIVETIIDMIRERAPSATRVGVLATTSALENRIHERGLEAAGMGSVNPDAGEQAAIQASIFDRDWGLKAHSAPPTDRARETLLAGIEHLRSKGAEAVILGCTELPLAVPETEFAGLPLINSTRALARALIRESHPEKLRPLEQSLGTSALIG